MADATLAKSFGFNPEIVARERIHEIALFIDVQLASAIDQFSAGTEDCETPGSRLAAQRGFSSLSIAREYLDELFRLEERPFANQTVGNCD